MMGDDYGSCDNCSYQFEYYDKKHYIYIHGMDNKPVTWCDICDRAYMAGVRVGTDSTLRENNLNHFCLRCLSQAKADQSFCTECGSSLGRIGDNIPNPNSRITLELEEE